MAKQSKTAKTARKAKAAKATEAEDDAPKHTVVQAKYKQRYAERGDPRNCGDWLAKVLKDEVVTPEGTDIAKLERICSLNGVDATYTNRSPGWQGRMRMTLGLKLRPVVAAEGGLYVPDGRSKTLKRAPREFVAKHTA